LKRIALVGYDSENPMRKRLLTALPGCCQYDRAADVEEVGNTVSKSQAAQTQQTKRK
jgi:hypothetical protein